MAGALLRIIKIWEPPRVHQQGVTQPPKGMTSWSAHHKGELGSLLNARASAGGVCRVSPCAWAAGAWRGLFAGEEMASRSLQGGKGDVEWAVTTQVLGGCVGQVYVELKLE